MDDSAASARRLTTEMEQTGRATGVAAKEANDFDARLRDAERSAGRLSTETAAMSLSAGRSVTDFTNVAQALGVSEAAARRVATEVLEAQTSANKLQDASLATARSLGLSDEEARRFATSMERASRETREAATQTDRLQSGFASIRGSVVGLVAGFGAFAAVRGIIRGLDDLVDSFVAFDQSITQSLAIVSNVTPEIRRQFEAVARTVSETLRFSAVEAGEAFFFLASAGFDVEQQLAALPQVAEFAQAGMFDLSTATTLLADSQSALGLRAKDAQTNLRNLTRVADVLTKANILSNAEVQQFAEALTNRAASAARTVGVELEEVVAVLAAFADQGLKGEAAGEAFAIVLRDIQTAALKNKDDFRDFGVAVFDAVGEIRPLADVIGDLERAFERLSDAQKRQALIDLGFQDRSIANLLVLLGTSEAIREYRFELEHAADATKDLAQNQLLSLGARLDIAKQKFENVKIELGEALVPAIETFLGILPGVIDAVRDLGPALEAVGRAAGDAAPAIADAATQALRFLEAAPRSAGILTNLGQIVGDFANLNRTLIAGTGLLAGFQTGLAEQNFDDFADALVRIRTNIEDIQFSRLEQGMVDSIREGRLQVLALADALIELNQGEGGASFAKIAQLARTAGISGKDLELVLKALVARAKEFGLSASQIQAFNSALINSAREGFVAQQAAAAAAVAALRDIPAAAEVAAVRIEHAADPLTSFFFEVNTVIEETGDSFADFVLGTSDAAFTLLSALEPVNQLRVQLLALGSDAEIAAQFFENTLTPSVIDAAGALQDLNDDGKTTADEFIANLETMATAALNFKADLATIALISPELAAALRELGPEAAAEIVRGLKANPQKILEAQAALVGTSTGLSENIQRLVTIAIGLLQTDPDAVTQFTAFVSTLNIPGATQAISEALNEALPSAFDLLNVPPIDLSDVGAGSADSFVGGMQERLAQRTDDLRDSIEKFTRNALQMDSPSKVMLALGAQAGASLIAGFVSAANRPIPVLTGAQFGTSASGGSAGTVVNFSNQNVIQNPVSRDVLSESARLEQLTGAAAANLKATFG